VSAEEPETEAGAANDAPPPAITAPSSGFWSTNWGWAVILVTAIVVNAAVIAVLAIVGHLHSPRRSHQVSYSSQVVLPFTGLHEPYDVAVDTAGNVYVADANNAAGNAFPADTIYNRVLELTAGSTTPVELPFTGLKNPSGVAVDTAGIVYIADYGNNRVLKLPAGSVTPVELPFTGLNLPEGVAVDTAGNVYITDYWNNRVLKLPAGSNTPVELPFTGLIHPEGVAVDAAGNVYISDYGNYRVLKLPAE